MAGRADIQAGSAFVRLFLKDELTTALKKIGSAALNLVRHGVDTFVKLGSELNDVAERMGTTADNLAALKFAGEQSGATIEYLEAAFKHMATEGIALTDFDKLAAEIAAIEDPTKRVARAVEVWGKAGAKLLPMIKELPALRAEAEELGLIPSPEDIARADELGDAFGKISAVQTASLFKIGSAAAYVLTPIVEAIAKILAVSAKWVLENQFILDSLKAIGDWIADFKIGIRFEIGLEKMLLFWRSFNYELTKDWTKLGALIESFTSPEMSKEIIRTLKDTNEENLVRMMESVGRLEELNKKLNEPRKLRDIPSSSLQDIWDFANQKASTFTTGGAIALGFGGGAAGGVAKMTLEEIRKGNKARFEMLKELREIKARQAKPGIFK